MLGQDLGIEVKGKSWSADCAYTHRFDVKAPLPSRAIFTIGFRIRDRIWSMLIQVYRPGMGLDWHIDGHNYSNRVVGVVLWNPLFGGDLQVRGPHKRWWIFHAFDGGLYEHRVTDCFGYRVVIMLQYGKSLPKKKGGNAK